MMPWMQRSGARSASPGPASFSIAPATFGTEVPGAEGRPYLWPGGSYLGSAGTWPHTQGGMSEYHVVKDFMIRVLPEGLSLRDASLAEPLFFPAFILLLQRLLQHITAGGAISGGTSGGNTIAGGSMSAGHDLTLIVGELAANAAEKRGIGSMGVANGV